MIKTQVITAYCPKCNTYIYSRHHCDIMTCICGETTITGGFDNTNIYTKSLDTKPITKIFTLPLTKQQLYRDYQRGRDKYGRIVLIGNYFTHYNVKLAEKLCKDIITVSN